MAINKDHFVHESISPVRWCDMDAFGHVNNSVYLSYFEQTRIEWWQKIAPPNIVLNETGPVIINAYCTFFKAITYPENLLIKLYVGPAGRSSYECYYEIFSANDLNILYAEGSTKVVWVDRKLEKSIPLPDYIRKNLPQIQ